MLQILAFRHKKILLLPFIVPLAIVLIAYMDYSRLVSVSIFGGTIYPTSSPIMCGDFSDARDGESYLCSSFYESIVDYPAPLYLIGILGTFVIGLIVSITSFLFLNQRKKLAISLLIFLFLIPVFVWLYFIS